MEKLKRIVRIALFFIKLGAAYVCAFLLKLFNNNYRNAWIISERGNDARDNGYFFYRYLCVNHPGINVWYSISSSSADFPKIQSLGKWVEYASFKHYIVYAASILRISSSMWGGDLPVHDYFFKLRKYMSHKRKFVFLKHGIIKDYLPQHCVSSGTPDLYICGAKPEYDYVKANFGHPEGVVKYTGLARFDNLHNIKTKNQVLIMPTFRTWLQGKNEKEVARSEYVRLWNEVLNDERIQNCLKKHQLKLIFYPHHVLQKYVDLFKSDNDGRVVAKFKDYDVQQLLIESKLLVTDFSSVFFDFGYMNKPVIYYQFDREKYIHNHYDFTQGYFSYDENGFGPVAFDHDTLVKEILESIEDNYAVSDEYQKRMDMFFPLNDSNNCDRIFKEVNLLMG